jgi:hypothetical protein
VLREFCLQHITRDKDHILETDPSRELVEEFGEALKLNLKPGQYICTPVATLVENKATPTDNIHARGIPTVRIYRNFEALIIDSSLTKVMLKSSDSLSRQDLCELAFADAQNGGRGPANAILTLPWQVLHDVYETMSLPGRNIPIVFEINQLDKSVGCNRLCTL